MSLGQAYIPSYQLTAEALERKEGSLLSLAGATIVRSGFFALGLMAGGVRDPSTVAKASLVASGLMTLTLVAAIAARKVD